MVDTLKTTEEIRSELLERLKSNLPDWLWVPGELQTDILDSVAEFHYKRERVVELFNSMKTTKGFRRLIDDTVYRSEMSDILGLSLNTRTSNVVFRGVPVSVTNDFDAFIYYYLDRFAERYGRKRGRGSAASGLFTFHYSPGISGTAKLIFENRGLLYTSTAVLDGSGVYSGMVFSFGYGSGFNVLAGNLRIRSVVSDVIALNQIFSFTTSDITGGTDYQSNDSFLQNLEGSLSLFSGPLSPNTLSKIVSDVPSVDKYKISKPSQSQRFIGSTDIYLKGGILVEKVVVKTVGSDNKILIPLQPSTLVSVLKAGAVVPTTEYTVTYPAAGTEYINSIKQLVWVEFAGLLVFPGDQVTLNLLVDQTVQDVYTTLASHYSDKNETARDLLVIKSVAQPVNANLKILTYRDIDYSIVYNLVVSALTKFINGLAIDAELQPDDLRFELRKIFYRGEVLIDSVNSLLVALPGGTYSSSNLSLTGGKYWELNTLSLEIL